MGGSTRWLAPALVLTLVGGIASAQDAPAIDLRADKILQIMSGVLTDAKQFTVHNVQTSDELTLEGDLVELSSSVDLALRRPDEAHAVLYGDSRPLRYWIGDGQLAMLDVKRWTYATTEVPSDLDTAVDWVWENLGIKFALADFVTGNPYEQLIGGVEWGSYVGLHEAEGVLCHHLAFG